MVRTLLAALLALLLSACRGGPQPADTTPYPPLEAADLGAMHNVSRSGEVWFGSAPGSSDLDLAVRRGVVRVIDLATAEETQGSDIAALCSQKGLRYLDAGASEQELLRDATVDLVLRELDLARAEPVLLFCGNGSRCAAFVAIHRVVQLGVPLEQALVEARRAGMKPGEPEAFVRAQAARLASAGP